MTATWPTGQHRLERHYRRLLLAYPGRYRRSHGTEITTTLLDLARPGQQRPRAGEALHLLASGIRQRFRLPAGRPLAVLAAVLVALVLGAFGAAAGSWLGVRTFADLPDDQARAQLAQRITGVAGERGQARWPSPWWDAMFGSNTEVRGDWDIEPARQWLAADGWTVSAVSPLDGRAARVDPVTNALVDLPMRNAEFTAESNGVVLQVRTFRTAEHGTVSVAGWARATPVFLPLIVAGAGLGAVAGWLLAAALAYRVRGAAPARRRVVTGLAGLALLALALPTTALYGNLLRAFQHAGELGPAFTVHSAFTPGGYYPFGPPWQVLALSVLGAAITAGAVLLARPADPPPPVPASVSG